MTYEDAVQYLIDHVPTEGLDSFSKWYDKCYDKLGGGNIFNNSRFNNMLEDYWLGEYGRFDLEASPPPRDTPESRAINLGAIPPPKDISPSIPVIIPETGKAPELPRPILIFPEDTTKREKKSILDRIKGFFRRKK